MYFNMFAAPVPNDKKDDYRKHASIFAQIITEAGCQRYVECWAEDVPDGEITSFIKAVQAKDNESVVVGWGEWPDKATCDAAMGKAMSDERMQSMQMPFDGKRVIFGGFGMLLEKKG